MRSCNAVWHGVLDEMKTSSEQHCVVGERRWAGVSASISVKKRQEDDDKIQVIGYHLITGFVQAAILRFVCFSK